MATTVAGLFKRRIARRLFLVLLLIPLAPVATIWAAATVALAAGCRVDQLTPCTVAWISVPEIIDGMLRVSAASIVGLIERSDRWLLAFNVATGVWLILCYFASARGWLDMLSRLLMGLLATIVCAFTPYFGPLLAIGLLAKEKLCEPNAGGIGVCMLFGGAVDSAHAAIRLAEPGASLAGVMLCGILYLIYSCIVIFSTLIWRERA